jgi:coiled-coil domain-containing protein 12
METTLAATAAARKERLIALRTRKAAHDAGETTTTHFAFKQRNFDPETRQAIRSAPQVDDTVEKAVEGMVEGIVAEDEERRKEELVSESIGSSDPRTCSTSSPSGQTGTSSGT